MKEGFRMTKTGLVPSSLWNKFVDYVCSLEIKSFVNGEFKTNIAGTSLSVKDFQPAITKLKEEIETINQKINAIEKEINDLQADVEQLEEDVQDPTTGLLKRVDDIEDLLNDIADSLTNIDTRLDDLEAKTANLF